MAKGGWCNYPKRCVPAPGEVGAGFKATCPCGKRVSVTVRGLFWRHKAMRASADRRGVPE
jgi:hypothetical protein